MNNYIECLEIILQKRVNINLFYFVLRDVYPASEELAAYNEDATRRGAPALSLDEFNTIKKIMIQKEIIKDYHE